MGYPFLESNSLLFENAGASSRTPESVKKNYGVTAAGVGEGGRGVLVTVGVRVGDGILEGVKVTVGTTVGASPCNIN